VKVLSLLRLRGLGRSQRRKLAEAKQNLFSGTAIRSRFWFGERDAS
jgi:hypothetical protein